MILYNDQTQAAHARGLTEHRGRDMGPRHWHGNEVSVLARMDVARPMPDGVSWRDTTSAWLRSSTPPSERRSLPRAPRLAVVLECEQCGEGFLAINDTQARYCGAKCRKRASRARRAAA